MLCTAIAAELVQLCTKTVERAVDKVGIGACRPSRIAACDVCTLFEQPVIYRKNNRLAWLFRSLWGSAKVVHGYCG